MHLPETLVRFARTHRDWLRETNHLVEFYKSCLNQIQYGMIDAEILQHCMQIVKGEEWNSTGKTDVGMGLVGPLPLDEAPSTEQAKERQFGNVEVLDEEEQSSDEEEEQYGSESLDVKMEDITELGSTHSGCPCLRPYKRTEVIYCDGLVCCPLFFSLHATDHKLMSNNDKCENKWFHLSCVQLEQRPAMWKCKKCLSPP